MKIKTTQPIKNQPVSGEWSLKPKNPNEQLQHYQDTLDEEIGVCPKCRKPTKWGELREWGNCLDCVSKYMDKKNLEETEKVKNPK